MSSWDFLKEVHKSKSSNFGLINRTESGDGTSRGIKAYRRCGGITIAVNILAQQSYFSNTLQYEKKGRRKDRIGLSGRSAAIGWWPAITTEKSAPNQWTRLLEKCDSTNNASLSAKPRRLTNYDFCSRWASPHRFASAQQLAHHINSLSATSLNIFGAQMMMT